MIVLPVPSLLSTPVLAELRHTDLITSEECERLQLKQHSFFWRDDLSDVFTVQRTKSPEVLSKTADILRRHGFEKLSRPLAGRLSRHIHLPVLCCTAEPPYDLVTSIDWRCP